MRSQFALVGTLLRKDLRLFGPFAALIAVLLALGQFPNLVMQLGSMGSLMQSGVELGTLLLILVVCYEDAIVSLKHDWLTRPIPGLTLLLEKSLFVLVAAVLPGIIGATAYNLTQGHSLAESLLAGVSLGARANTVMMFVTIMAFAAITANIRHAVIVFLAGMAAIALVMVSWNAVEDASESAVFSGVGWMVRRGMLLLMLSAAISILWLQYRHRHTRASRFVAVVATVIGTCIVVVPYWTPAFALQKMLSPDPSAAQSVGVAMAEGCFPARVLDAAPVASNSVTASLTLQRYSEEHRRFAGSGAIAFATRLIGEKVPDGNLLVVDHVTVRYFSGAHELRHLRPGITSYKLLKAVEGQPVADHFWLLSAADGQRLSTDANVVTHIDYSLGLLAPHGTAHIVADGGRAYYEGIGYCGATFDRSAGTVALNCFKPGAQPALLVANIEGDSELATERRHPTDYTPVALDFWGGSQHDIQLLAHGAGVPRITVTAYKARAHFDRQVRAPGVLGGPTSACPLP